MKFCNQCGAQLEDDMLFCNMCGAKQEAAPAAPEAAPAPEPVAPEAIPAIEPASGVLYQATPAYTPEVAPAAGVSVMVNAESVGATA